MNARFAASLMIGMLLAAGAPQSFGQAQSQAPVRLVLPFAAGSGTDTYARLIGQHLSPALGVPVVVDNRPGANGSIAAEFVARAKPDGTTLLLTTNTTHAANPHLMKDLRYDPIKDFQPITRLGNLTFLFVTSSSSGFDTLRQLMAEAKRKPKAVSYGSGNSLGIIAGAKLAQAGGVELTHVPYKSTPQALADLIGGQITVAIIDTAAAASQLKAGKVRALAVISRTRSRLLPDVPSMEEEGFSGFEIVAWWALFAPAGTPTPVVGRIQEEVARIIDRPDVKERAGSLGIDAFTSTPEELRVFVRSQIDLWGRLVSEAGLRPE